MSKSMSHMDLVNQEPGIIVWSRPHVGLVVTEVVTLGRAMNPTYYCPFNWTGVV